VTFYLGRIIRSCERNISPLRLMEVSHVTHGGINAVRAVRLTAKKALVVLVIAIGLPGSLMLMASAANAQDARDARTAASMAALKDKTAKLGAPKIEGTEEVGGKSAPVLYFGSTKMNNNFTIVDEVAKEGGPGMAVTLFVKAGIPQARAAGGDEYIRVATSVRLAYGIGRAVGTVMGSPALDSIKAGEPYYGEVEVLGTPYIAHYEPIKDASGETIAAYFVGYKK
jgi:Cache 3/Cache 2 fusion domain